MSDGTHTKIWFTPNLFAASPVWDTGAQFDGTYTLIRPSNNTPGSLLAYSPDTAPSVTTIDFTQSDGGFVLQGGAGARGTWVNGTGWVDTCGNNSGAYSQGVTIQKTFGAPLNVSSIVVTYDATAGHDDGFLIQALVFEDQANNYPPGVFGTDKTIELMGSFTDSTLLLTIDSADQNGGCPSPAGSVVIKSVVINTIGSNAQVIYSNDYGATLGTPIDLGSSPGSVGGFDLQHNGTVSYAAALNEILKATTLGGSYSSDEALTGVNAAMIELPWYTRNSLTALNSGSSPEYIYGLDAPDGAGHTLYWKTSGSPVNITPTISGNPGVATNANCLATWKGRYIGAVLSFAGVLHLVTSTSGGSAWIDRGAVDGAYTRVRRQSASAGQLYMAGNVLDYSATFGKNVISKTKPSSDPLQFFEPYG